MPSKWTRRVAAQAAVLAVGTLAVAAGSPAAASAETLSMKDARKLANELVLQQKQKRSLVFAQLGDPKRRSSTRIDFPYRDRSTSDVLCTARIVAVQSGRSQSADMTGAKCHGIPHEVLAFEAATRALSKYVKAHKDEILASLDRYDGAVFRCRNVAVPKDRRDEVRVLFTTAGVRSFYAPLRARLDEFVSTLRAEQGADPELGRGAKAWDRNLVLFDQLPAATAKPCAALKQWAASGFTDDTAPANFAELKVIRDQFRVQSTVLDDVAVYLDDQGAIRRIARAFAPQGLLALVDPDRTF